MGDDIYIQLSVNAFNYIRSRQDIDNEIKDFTYIAESIISSMESIYEIETGNYEEVYHILLYSLYEYEKVNFENCSRGMCALFRSLIGELKCMNFKTE